MAELDYIESHTMDEKVIGQIKWSHPMRITFHYPDMTKAIFKNIVGMRHMSTGCYVYIDTSDEVYVVPSGHRYIHQKPEVIDGQT